MRKAAEYIRLYKEINRLTKLQNRRHPMFYKKMAMKVFMVVMNIFVIGYLFFIGVMLKDILQSARAGMEPYNLFNEGMLFLLILDMAFRFIGQETPSVKARPFLLLPVPRKMVTDCYLGKILLMPVNLLWMALLIPFTVKAVFPFYGVGGCIGYLFGWWLLIVLNSYFYLLTRTLLLKHILWIALPIVIYGGLLSFVFLPDVDFMGYFFMYLGEGWMQGQLWTYLLIVVGIILLFLLNRSIQTRAIYSETAGEATSKTPKRQIRTDFTWFNRFGITGEFIKMEIKSVSRNKTICSQMVMLAGATILFSLILTFSPDVYGTTGNAFWLYYCFYMMTTPLLHTLSTEGNYMDGLMVRKELLIDLLKGKYFFYCLLELMPLLLMLPAVIASTVTTGCWLAYYLIVIGFCIPVSMQTAPFTNYSTPMNQKLTGGNSNNNIGITFLWMGIVMAAPLGIQFMTGYFFSNTVAYLVLSFLGIIGFLTNPYWLTSLYKCICLRRYHNMEGFRSSRQL